MSIVVEYAEILVCPTFPIMKNPAFSLKSALVVVLLCLLSSLASGQKSGDVKIPQISGTWIINPEKSYSKSERSKLSNYTLTISQAADEIKLIWDYTIDGRRSFYSEILVTDGRESEYPRTHGADTWEPWGEVTRWKKNRLVRKFNYRSGDLKNRNYRDRQEFFLNETGDQLTVVTVYVNRVTASSPPRNESGPIPPSGVRGRIPVQNSRTTERKLVFSRKP